MSEKHVLVTGAAGFIGFHIAHRPLQDGSAVVGVDSLTPYCDPELKEARLEELARHKGFRFIKLDLADRMTVSELFATEKFPFVVHLAAQAGVRHSLIAPRSYADANLQGFLNVLEGCRHNGSIRPRLSCASVRPPVTH